MLVEKEWLGFGHKMSDRNQFVSGHDKEVSPIFLQFLEATWQISQQYPRAFEFNELFLIEMHDCLISSRFGTFLCNSERERRDLRLRERTHSVWTYLCGGARPLPRRRNPSHPCAPGTRAPRTF